VGKYGETAFLATYYGVSEICQAFCRLSAVYGGTFILRRGASHLVVSEQGDFEGVVCSEGQKLTAPWLVASEPFWPTPPDPSQPGVSRCVCVAAETIIPGKHIAMLVLPPGTCGNDKTVFVMQTDASLQACPEDKVLWLLWTTSSGRGPEADLSPAVEALQRLQPAIVQEGQERPEGHVREVYWTGFYEQGAAAAAEGGAQEPVAVPFNVVIVPPPSRQVDHLACSSCRVVMASARLLTLYRAGGNQ